MPHYVDVTISTKVIDKSNEVLITFSRIELIGPKPSVCIRPNKSLALSLCSAKGALVILSSKQDSHVSNDSKPN